MSESLRTLATIESVAERADTVLQNLLDCNPVIRVIDTGTSHEVRCYLPSAAHTAGAFKALEPVFRNCNQISVVSNVIVSRFFYT